MQSEVVTHQQERDAFVESFEFSQGMLDLQFYVGVLVRDTFDLNQISQNTDEHEVDRKLRLRQISHQAESIATGMTEKGMHPIPKEEDAAFYDQSKMAASRFFRGMQTDIMQVSQSEFESLIEKVDVPETTEIGEISDRESRRKFLIGMLAHGIIEKELLYLQDGRPEWKDNSIRDKKFLAFKQDKFRSHLQYHAVKANPVYFGTKEYDQIYTEIGAHLKELKSADPTTLSTLELARQVKLNELTALWESRHSGKSFWD